MRLPGEPTFQEMTLVALAAHPRGLSPAELAERFRVPYGRVHNALSRLVAKRLAVAVALPGGGRLYFLVDASTLPVMVDAAGVNPFSDRTAVCPGCQGPKDTAWIPEAVCETCFRAAVRNRSGDPPAPGPVGTS